MTPKLLSLAHAATLYDCSLSTLKRAIARGDLPACRLQKKLYLKPADIDALFTPVRPPAPAVIDLKQVARDVEKLLATKTVH